MNKAAVRYISVGQSFKANGICYKAVCNGSDIGDRGIVTCVAKRDYKRWLRAALFKHPWAGEQFQYPGKFGISDGINLTDEGLYDFIKERSNT